MPHDVLKTSGAPCTCTKFCLWSGEKNSEDRIRSEIAFRKYANTLNTEMSKSLRDMRFVRKGYGIA